MAQKSTYLQAPYTVDDLVNTIKDGFSVVGFDTSQTTDDSVVFDSDYYISKIKMSPLNLLVESEQLINPQYDYGTNGHNSFFGTKIGWGSDAYLEKNLDTNFPFSMFNVIKPRLLDKDTYLNLPVSGLVAGNTYTFSLYLKSPAAAKFPVFIRTGTTIHSEAKLDTGIGWSRASYSFVAPSTSFTISIGSFGKWMGERSHNILYYSEALQIYTTTNATTNAFSEDAPMPHTYYKASTIKNSHATNYGYVYYSISNLGTLAGRTFTISAYMKVITGSPNLVLSDAGSNNSVTLDPAGSTLPIELGVWKRYSYTFTFPQGTTSTTINAHYGLPAGAEAVVWGTQVEEANSMGSFYVPTHGFDVKTPTFVGELNFSGLQLELGNTVSSYKPNTSWMWKDCNLTLNDSLTNEAIFFKTLIPPCTTAVFQNCKEVSVGETYMGSYTAFYTNSLTNTSAYVSNNFNQVIAFLTTNALGNSASTAYISPNNTTGYRIPYLVDVLRLGTGTVPISGTYTQAISAPQESKNSTITASANIISVLFKVSNRSDSYGLPAGGKARGIVLHGKSPGAGKRKYVSYAAIENTSNSTIALKNNNFSAENNLSSGLAEIIKGPLSTVIEKKFPFYLSGSLHLYDSVNSLGLRRAEFIKTVTLPKNSDLFNFLQGSSEGCVHAINVNSNFVHYLGVFDLINPILIEDNGSEASRYVTLTEHTSNSIGMVLHGCGTVFSEYYINTTPDFKGYADDTYDSSIMQYPVEIYGDSYSANAAILPVYAGTATHTHLSNRGIVKGLFIANSSYFTGNPGDLMLTQDNSKYFCFNKRVISSRGTYALFVKV